MPYCNIYGHVRVWAGGADAKPSSCDCGAVRYETHKCTCGNEHEIQVVINATPHYYQTSAIGVSPLMPIRGGELQLAVPYLAME